MSLDKKDYEEIARLLKVVVENDIVPKLQILAEGQRTILDTLAPKSRVDELEEEVAFLKTVIKMHSEQIAALTKA